MQLCNCSEGGGGCNSGGCPGSITGGRRKLAPQGFGASVRTRCRKGGCLESASPTTRNWARHQKGWADPTMWVSAPNGRCASFCRRAHPRPPPCADIGHCTPAGRSAWARILSVVRDTAHLLDPERVVATMEVLVGLFAVAAATDPDLSPSGRGGGSSSSSSSFPHVPPAPPALMVLLIPGPPGPPVPPGPVLLPLLFLCPLPPSLQAPGLFPAPSTPTPSRTASALCCAGPGLVATIPTDHAVHRDGAAQRPSGEVHEEVGPSDVHDLDARAVGASPAPDRPTGRLAAAESEAKGGGAVAAASALAPRRATWRDALQLSL